MPNAWFGEVLFSISSPLIPEIALQSALQLAQKLVQKLVLQLAH
jgi:hypothetical protein